MQIDESHIIATPEALRDLYGPPLERSLLKQRDSLDHHCRAFLDRCPFFLLATSAPNGGPADCSPRGDRPGFVRVVDDSTILIPDRRGNSRVDSLNNIVANPNIGLLFLIPGVNETLRINGIARISTDPTLTQSFAVDGKAPRTVLIVQTREVYLHCSRAFLRSNLWNPEHFADRATLPSMGTIMADHTNGAVNAANYDEEAKTRFPATLY